MIFICILVYHTEMECRIFRMLKVSKLNKRGSVHREITTSLLEHEAPSQGPIQLVTHSEIEVQTSKRVITSEENEREGILTLLSE